MKKTNLTQDQQDELQMDTGIFINHGQDRSCPTGCVISPYWMYFKGFTGLITITGGMFFDGILAQVHIDERGNATVLEPREEAIEDYKRRLLGQKIVIDSYSKDRREIQCPNEWL